MKAALVISHGSRSSKTKEEVESLAAKIKKQSGLKIVEYAFLELESPTIPEGIDNCIKKNAEEVIILLNFLNAGRHVDEDIPHIVAQARKKHPNVKIRISKPVGQHPDIVNLFVDLLQ
jgi:sirohydrochlorin cobaltochelatase